MESAMRDRPNSTEPLDIQLARAREGLVRWETRLLSERWPDQRRLAARELSRYRQKVRLIEEAIAERDGPGDPAADKGGFQAEQIMLIEEETR